MPFELPNLSYQYADLEPYIDALTMEIHHSKHHATYVNNLNKTLAPYSELQDKTIEELITNLNKLPEEIVTAVKNNGGGHYNHSFFWKVLTPQPQFNESGVLATDINETFSSLQNFKMEFGKAALNRFGSGWAWLIVDTEKKLNIVSTPNQDSPLSDGFTPLLCLDVWEHAYYLKHQNKRADYINTFWSVVNWTQVEENYKAALDLL